jgi:hypothetical protein
MSLTAILVFGVLGLDFVIYCWFCQVFGDRRQRLVQEVALLRAQLPGLRSTAKDAHANTIPYRPKVKSYAHIQKQTDGTARRAA